MGGFVRRVRCTMHRLRWEERGASTAEYAVTTMAAVGFAGALLMLLRGDEVRSVLADLVRRALTVDG
jgi:Flp pilus assembly pilin Flp